MKIYGAVAGDEAIILKLKEYPEKFHGRLSRVVERLAIRLQGKVISEKLSGQVLKTRTGTLRRSINYRIIDHTNEVTAVVGANTPYAGFWEYGFKGTVSVRGFIRTLKQKGTVQNVRPHTRKIDQAARSYLRSSLAEMKEEILAEMQKAVKED